jgi:hypothetical protein
VSYLLLHAAALLVRATVVFLLSSLESAKNYYVFLGVVGFGKEDEEEEGVLILSVGLSKDEEEEFKEEERREQQQQIKVVQLKARKKRRGITTTTKIFAHKYGKHAAQFWGFSFMGSCANALRSFGRLPVGALTPFFELSGTKNSLN